MSDFLSSPTPSPNRSTSTEHSPSISGSGEFLAPPRNTTGRLAETNPDVASAQTPGNVSQVPPVQGVADSGLNSSAPLDCEGFEEHLQNLLDARLDPELDPEVTEHLAMCHDCPRVLHEYLLLETALRSLPGNSKMASLNRPNAEASGHEARAGSVSSAPGNAAFTSRQRPPLKRHPVSIARHQRKLLWIQAALVLILLGSLGFAFIRWQHAEATLLPVPSRFAAASSSLPSGVPTHMAGINRVVHYRSLEQCYSLTTELPGVKPLQTSIVVALDWWQDYLGIRPSQLPKSHLIEPGFGLNPLLADGWHRA